MYNNIYELLVSDIMMPEIDGFEFARTVREVNWNFDACVDEIGKLEKARTSATTMYVIILGVIGTALVAGSVFAVTAQTPYYVLSILLAVPGFLGWIFPYFLYRKIAGRQTEKITPLIEAKYDEIYEICEKGNKLLY